MGADTSSTSTPAWSLPISKLRGVTQVVRVRLKSRRITNCGHLLEAAGPAVGRAGLARASGIAPDILEAIVQRADMARVNGIGVVFGLMLEDLGVRDVQTLAGRDADALHAELRDLNQAERIARRSPTAEEVADWVTQARALRPLVGYDAPTDD